MKLGLWVRIPDFPSLFQAFDLSLTKSILWNHQTIQMKNILWYARPHFASFSTSDQPVSCHSEHFSFIIKGHSEQAINIFLKTNVRVLKSKSFTFQFNIKFLPFHLSYDRKSYSNSYKNLCNGQGFVFGIKSSLILLVNKTRKKYYKCYFLWLWRSVCKWGLLSFFICQIVTSVK